MNFDSLLTNPWILVLALIFGFVFLVFGADGLVNGASGLAKRFGVSNLVIGMTVVAFGTSMPEFVVNMFSVAEGSTDLALTNILGSNIINIFIILGLTAIVYPISSTKQTRDFDIPLTIIAGFIVFVFVAITLPFEQERGLSRLGGIILLLIFVIFMAHNVKYAKQGTAEQQDFQPMKIWKALLYIFFGLVGLVVGGEMIVKSAVKMAQDLGVSDAIIGLTIVALGTSLPELATSVIAAFKHNCDLALGNVIGSVSFNVFFVLGASAVIIPLPAYIGIELDSIMATSGAALVWLFIKTNKERQLKRWHGLVFLLIYATYLTYRLMSI